MATHPVLYPQSYTKKPPSQHRVSDTNDQESQSQKVIYLLCVQQTSEHIQTNRSQLRQRLSPKELYVKHW